MEYDDIIHLNVRDPFMYVDVLSCLPLLYLGVLFALGPGVSVEMVLLEWR